MLTAAGTAAAWRNSCAYRWALLLLAVQQRWHRLAIIGETLLRLAWMRKRRRVDSRFIAVLRRRIDVVDVAQFVVVCLLTTRRFFTSVGFSRAAAAAGERVGRGCDWRRACGSYSAHHCVAAVASVEAGQHRIAFFALFLFT